MDPDTAPPRSGPPARAQPRAALGAAWLEQAIHRVAPISPWALRLLSMSPDAEGSDTALCTLISSDPALVARVLGTANSRAFNTGGADIAQVDHAIRRLGTREVWRIAAVLALGASARIRPPLRGAKRALWAHSFTVAHAARAVARAAAREPVDPDGVYVAGLLHDIGLMVLLSTEPERSATMLARASDPSVGWSPALEAEVGLPPHARIGAALCRHWGLPDALVLRVDAHGRIHPLDQPAHDRPAAAALELGHQLAESVTDRSAAHRRVTRDDAPLLRTFLRVPEAEVERIRAALVDAGPRIAAIADAA